MSQALLTGIDVSEWRGNVDWQTVQQAGIAFAFARATYGATLVDPQFNANWQGIRAAGLVRGTYHFFVTADDPTKQATLFLKTVGSLDDTDLPPVLDVELESGTGSNLISGVQTWLGLVEQGFGRQPMIYTGPSFWNEYMTGGFGSYPLWISEYEVSAPTQVNGWDNWTFWQYSSTGTVAGISGNIDLDYFNGSSDDLKSFITSPASAKAINRGCMPLLAGARRYGAPCDRAAISPAHLSQAPGPDLAFRTHSHARRSPTRPMSIWIGETPAPVASRSIERSKPSAPNAPRKTASKYQTILMHHSSRRNYYRAEGLEFVPHHSSQLTPELTRREQAAHKPHRRRQR